MDRKQKNNKGVGLIAVVLLFVIGTIESAIGDESAFAGIFAFVLVAFVVIVVLTAIVKNAKRAASSGKTENTHAPRTTVVPDRREEFSAPDAYCVVCDHTGEDHFARDKALRIAQLDDWLKNGIIDKDEYRVMKERYERGM